VDPPGPVDPVSDDAERPAGARKRAEPSLRARVLRLLARREHSREELRRKLSGAGVDLAELGTLLDEFEQRGWLSEQRLAEQVVAGARGRYGSRRVLDQLRQKGVTGGPLEQATQVLKAQELESARAVWRKRFGRLPADIAERAKQRRFLEGRGFAPEVVRLVLKLGHNETD
jgi:regulatory protein